MKKKRGIASSYPDRGGAVTDSDLGRGGQKFIRRETAGGIMEGWVGGKKKKKGVV